MLCLQAQAAATDGVRLHLSLRAEPLSAGRRRAALAAAPAWGVVAGLLVVSPRPPSAAPRATPRPAGGLGEPRVGRRRRRRRRPGSSPIDAGAQGAQASEP